MNIIDAFASLDTSYRIAPHVFRAQLVKGVKPSLMSNALTLVSVENIDTLEPHFAVSTLDATRSWYSTSIQLIANASDMYTWCIRNSNHQ